MLHGYWNKVNSGRVTRRRAIAATGGAALGAAFLAACGGGDSGGGSGVKGDASGLLVPSVDTSKQAKRGGIIKVVATQDPSTLDVHQAISPLCMHKDFTYSRLLRVKPGYLEEAGFEYTGDLAESYEYAPDRLSMTMKLRPGVKFHDKPPVNGRAMDVEDVLFSWQRAERTSSGRLGFANSVNPSAPIVNFTAPDSRTVVVKVSKPVAYLEAMLARITTGYLHVVPKETDSSFNIRGDMIGTGPYVMERYQPSQGFTYKRFADYYDKERPYIDGADVPIITEYAARLAQFRTGNLHYATLNAEDILPIKGEIPEMDMYATDPTGSSTSTQFGWLPKSPFLDERVRRAYSMSIDRDLWIDTRFNVPQYEAAGIPVVKKWQSVLWHVTDGWWLDPKDSKSFGSNAQYFQHNLAESKKLLAAAGYPNGLDVESYANRTGAGMYDKWTEIIEAMVTEGGFRIKVNLIDYATDFIPNYRDGLGKFTGLTYKVGPGPADDPVSQSIFEYHSKGGANFHGFDVNGRGDQSGDPAVESMLEKAEAEFDLEKRKALVHELQRYLSGKLYTVRFPGGASGLALSWPAVQNFRVYRGDNRREFYHWLDTTKAPYVKT